MKYVYFTKTTSKPYFQSLFDSSIVKPQQQDQKFHGMMIEGIAKNGCDITVISARPINRSNLKQRYFKKEIEVVDGIEYSYLPFVNKKGFKQIWLFLSAFFTGLRIIRKYGRKQVVFLVDPLIFSLSLASIKLAVVFRIKRVAVLTDLPYMLEQGGRVYKSMATTLLKYYTHYVVLTKQMMEQIRYKNKPFVVIEGMVEESIMDYPKTNHDVFQVMYAGGFAKSNYIDLLLQSISKMNPDIIELHLYGNGELKDVVMDYSNQYPHIKYHGSKLNKEVLKAERDSDLLINLRNPEDPFTMYSFPSKLMEYMASGTPVLCTKLKGIPDEYDSYLNYLNELTECALINKLEEIMQTQKETLLTFGQHAKHFCQHEKNYLVQAAKVIDLVK